MSEPLTKISTRLISGEQAALSAALLSPLAGFVVNILGRRIVASTLSVLLPRADGVAFLLIGESEDRHTRDGAG
jgi:hypothetical protein